MQQNQDKSNKMKNIFWIIIIGLFITACKSDPSSGWQEMNLLEYGIPGDIKAPLDAEVKTMDFGAMKDISVKKGEDYYIQIYSSQATTMNVADVKAQQLALLKEDPAYQRMVSEEDNGFIYELKVDSAKMTYGFRHIKLQGDKEYIYQTGLIGFFTEDQVKKMYEAVK